MRPKDPFADAERLIRRVYSYVAYRIGPGVEAEDVAAETFERAVRYRDSFDPTKGDAAAWAIGIARRVLATQRTSPPAADPEQQAASAEDSAEAALRCLEVREAIARLGDRDRELIALRYGADLSAREIAALLEMKTNAVEVALHRALRSLRAELSPEPLSTQIAQPMPQSVR